MRKLLVTGGAGFIGSNLVKYLIDKYPSDQIVVLDALTYAGNLDNLPPPIWDNDRFSFHRTDIRNRDKVQEILTDVDVVFHLAAETHVDNSIYNTDDFVDTDVKGTQVLLDAVRKFPVERFVHISTSEVYGTLLSDPMDEEHPLKPRSPYASAKTGADRLAYSYVATFDLPVVIIRPFNNYGPNQHIEKLIPCFTTHALQDKQLPMQGDGSSSRDWLYVEDTCRGLAAAMEADLKAVKGEVFNLATNRDESVIEIGKLIVAELGKSESLIETVPDRPGQVDRHKGSFEKAKSILKWEPAISFEQGLKRTVQWYVENESWWRNNRVAVRAEAL
ncbi:MAG: dTDP-glucose 4,6-dehydratase [Candidatus Omnitrophica bacterium]|nr:dTDP-glucose 4,6-dehydratase [Candidatus Omnitrophota bacterium]